MICETPEQCPGHYPVCTHSKGLGACEDCIESRRVNGLTLCPSTPTERIEAFLASYGRAAEFGTLDPEDISSHNDNPLRVSDLRAVLADLEEAFEPGHEHAWKRLSSLSGGVLACTCGATRPVPCRVCAGSGWVGARREHRHPSCGCPCLLCAEG